jgi:hypothetical protein
MLLELIGVEEGKDEALFAGLEELFCCNRSNCEFGCGLTRNESSTSNPAASRPNEGEEEEVGGRCILGYRISSFLITRSP